MCAWLCIIMPCGGLLKCNFQYVDPFLFSTGERGARDEEEEGFLAGMSNLGAKS